MGAGKGCAAVHRPPAPSRYTVYTRPPVLSPRHITTAAPEAFTARSTPASRARPFASAGELDHSPPGTRSESTRSPVRTVVEYTSVCTSAASTAREPAKDTRGSPWAGSCGSPGAGGSSAVPKVLSAPHTVVAVPARLTTTTGSGPNSSTLSKTVLASCTVQERIVPEAHGTGSSRSGLGAASVGVAVFPGVVVSTAEAPLWLCSSSGREEPSPSQLTGTTSSTQTGTETRSPCRASILVDLSAYQGVHDACSNPPHGSRRRVSRKPYVPPGASSLSSPVSPDTRRCVPRRSGIRSAADPCAARTSRWLWSGPVPLLHA